MLTPTSSCRIKFSLVSAVQDDEKEEESTYIWNAAAMKGRAKPKPVNATSLMPNATLFV